MKKHLCAIFWPGVPAHPARLVLQQVEDGGCSSSARAEHSKSSPWAGCSGQEILPKLIALMTDHFLDVTLRLLEQSPHAEGLAAHSAHAQEAPAIPPLPQINDGNRRSQVPGFAFRTAWTEQHTELGMWISLSSEPQHSEKERRNNQHQALALISAFWTLLCLLKYPRVSPDERAGAQST